MTSARRSSLIASPERSTPGRSSKRKLKRGGVALGLVMIAGESLSFARFADRAEIKLRRLARWVAAVWAASPASAKVLMMLALTFCAIASGYGIYRLIFGS